MTRPTFFNHPDVASGALNSAVGTLVVLIGVGFGATYVRSGSPDFLTACSRFDGRHYTEIAERGYAYDPAERSTVAFFPAYPLIGRATAAATGLDVRAALLVVSNLMLVGATVLFTTYLRTHPLECPPAARALAVSVFAFWPASFFFRMAYSESTFLLFSLLFLIGLTRRWPPPLLALVSGVVTATRPVGVAASVALLWSITTDASRGRPARRVGLAVLYAPLSAWGLLAYMGCQYEWFGSPIAFAQTQVHWTVGSPGDMGFREKVESLASFEPVLGVYQSDSLRYWARDPGCRSCLFCLAFWNPILFGAAFVLVLVGLARNWLTGPEAVFGLALLAIPYLTRGCEMSMASHGRFAAAVVPAYLVLGRCLSGLPAATQWPLIVVLAPVLTTWSALFAAGYLFF